MKHKHEKQVLDWVTEAQNSQYLSNLRAETKANRAFYYGEQWDEKQAKYYRSKGIEPITVNRIKPIVKTALGIYLQNRQDIRLLSNRTEDGYVTGVANSVLKHAEQRSGSQKKYERLFMYGAVDKVSFLKYETDMYRTINGDPELKVLTDLDVDYDPTCKTYNLNESCRYIIEKEWIYKDEALMLYPDLKVGTKLESSVNATEAMIAFHTGETAVATYEESNDNELELDLELRDKNKIMLKHVWWKELVKGFIVSNGKESRYTPDKEVADQLKEAGYKIKVVPEYTLHKTTVFNNAVIQDEENPLGKEVKDFPFFRYSPLFYDGHNIGIVDNLLSLNVEENTYRTLVQKFLMRSINQGYYVNGGSEQAKIELTQSAGMDDIIIDKQKFGGDVEPINPAPFPVAFQMQANEYDNLIKSVSGISDSMLGSDSGDQSGRAIYLKTQQNKIQFQEILENLFTTIQSYGNFLFRYIITNDIYTDDEIMNIVSESDLLDPALMQKATDMLLEYTGGIGLPQPNIPAPPSPELMAMIRPEDKARLVQQVQIGTRAAQDYMEQYPRMQRNFENTVKIMAKKWLLERYRSEDLKNYGVEVSISPSAVTEAMAAFSQLVDLNNATGGGAVPPDILVETSIVSEQVKDKIKKRFQAAPANGVAPVQNATGDMMRQMAATGMM